MNQVADRIERVLNDVRNNRISTLLARERIDDVAQAARATLKQGSDHCIALDIVADGANAYLSLVENHSDEPAFRLDGALASVKRKVERLRKFG